MTQQHINLGTAPGGVDGDTNRTANTKTEANFTELYAGFNPVGGFKNLIINGNFHFWQRGTSLAAGTGGYLCDRWQSFAIGSTVAPSQQAFVLGQTAVPNGPTYFHRVVVASVAGAGNYALLMQKMEGLERFSGAQCTASFWAKADANRSVGFEIQKIYGTGGSTTETAIGAIALNLTTVWQKFTVTFTVTSNAGKTIAGGNDSLIFVLWMDAGSTFATRASNIGQQSGTFDVAQIQIEKGAIATPFELRPIGAELALCQRYYEKTFSNSINPANASQGPQLPSVAFLTTAMRTIYDFAVAKRAVPAIAFYSSNQMGSPTAGQWQTWVASAWVNASATTASTITTGFVNIDLTTTGLTTNGAYLATGNLIADAEL